MPKGECLQILRDHSHVVECVAFAPANLIPIPSMQGQGNSTAQDSESKETTKPVGLKGFIASGSRDKQIKIWELATGKCVATYVCPFFNQYFTSL
jgi:platelet-activating factor acetylhydrolase IB subunit alpha